MNPIKEKNKINIMYCESNTDGTVGGSFFSLLYLVSGLNKDLYNPIVVFHKKHSLLPKYTEAGIKTIILEKPSPLVFKAPKSKVLNLAFVMLKPFQKIINFIKFFPLTAIQYAKLMKSYNIDLVHLNNSIVRNHDWILASKLIGIKCVTHERGINRSYSRMSKYFAPKLNAIVCISNAVKSALINNGIKPDNITTIYNAIDPEIIKVTEDSENILNLHKTSKDKLIIGVVGNIKEWKGQETMIRALPAVLDKYPNIVCFFVGDTSIDDQYYKDRLLHLINKNNLQDNVIFTGYTENVANYLNIMQIVIHTSISPEPFGRVLIEAMSMKKPLIGTRAGAVTEIIDEGVSGYTYEPGNYQDLSDRVLDILDNKELADSMSHKGYDLVHEKFNIKTNISSTQDLYQNILNKVN